jgi:glyoxylase-like metal-dependent hydrolase (beta-lactamase superfamily II)
MEKYGITAEQAAGGSPDLRWLVERGDGSFFAAGDRLPLGIEVFEGRERNDVALWIPDRRAVVVGDTIADFGDGFRIQPEWLKGGVTREQVAARLRPLLELPVEHVLPAHGAPTDRSALERALA